MENQFQPTYPNMNSQETLQDLLHFTEKSSLLSILDCLQGVLESRLKTTDSISSDLISVNFLDEVQSFHFNDNVSLYFGKSLNEIKCVLKDVDNSREHQIFFQYKGPRKLTITSVSLPYSPWQDQDYSTIEAIVCAFSRHLEDLAGFFHELECIDRCCTVMEPVNPSFKEDYRRIVLDDRIWLHVEVTPDGLATNIHLIGQSEYWQVKLQEGLLKWNHDVDIVTNIMHIFDMTEFPTVKNKSGSGSTIFEDQSVEMSVCSICLCNQLPDISGVPLPLCQNPTCGIYFHRTCLFQWLVACAGSRPPAFGVATGSCPTCLQPVSCNEKDS